MALPDLTWVAPVTLLALLALAMWVVVRLRAHRAGADDHPAPVPVPPEESELTEGPVWACLRCASTAVRAPAISEGHVPGAGDSFSWICGRCASRGPPLRFDDPTAYREFVKALHAEQRPAESATAELMEK